jgi:hypothetical protein
MQALVIFLDFCAKVVGPHEAMKLYLNIGSVVTTGKTQILLWKLCLCVFQIRETTIYRKNSRQCHLNDILQVIIGREHYIG